MHPIVFQRFDDICASFGVCEQVLEIGIARDARPLLDCPSLSSVRRRVGIGLDVKEMSSDYEVYERNANDLSCFPDDQFDLILSNSTLEHDNAFWLTVSEMKRVLRPGGLLIVGVPGFGKMGTVYGRRLIRKLSWMRHWPIVGSRLTSLSEHLNASAPTLGVHNFPSDYYRFSRAAMDDVILSGLDDRAIHDVLNPPRFIGVGRKPFRHGE